MGNVFAVKSKKAGKDDVIKYKLSIRQLGKTFDLNIIDIKNHVSCKYICSQLDKPISFLQGINNKLSFYNNDKKVDLCEFKIDLSNHAQINFDNKKYYELYYITSRQQTLYIRYESFRSNKLNIIYKFDHTIL